MTLPDLALQAVYGRLAWAVVLAAVLIALWPRARSHSRALVPVLLCGTVLLMLLPGAASPAWWLGLALQYPSGLLAFLCLVFLHARWLGRPAGAVLPLPLAATLALAGAVLYLDAIGWLALGVYYAGFGPLAAPVLAVLGVAGCALLLMRGQGGPANVALLCALLLFCLLRLPTGNLWDAVLDPLLWAWALTSLVRRGWRSRMPARGADRHIFIK